MIRKIFVGVIVLTVSLVVIYHEMIGYGLRQAIGQLTIVWKARPISEVLADENFPDSLKLKLRLVEKVRQFAIDSLGLKDTRNYHTIYNQQGKEVMWVVTASEPFRLEEKQWVFPVLGSVPYKGFFNKDLALKEKAQLVEAGWDVDIRNPGGWSTLGWFRDPILSKMLERSEGDLASLVIHEMVHATIFVKDSIDFNENLASFIGDRGAEQFLIRYFGNNSKEHRQFLQEDREFITYADHMLRGYEYLDSLYNTIQNFSHAEKSDAKYRAITRIIQTADTLSLFNIRKPSVIYKDNLPNNAYFMSFKRYRSRQDIFWDEWVTRFHGNLKNYVRYLSDKHPFL